MSTTPEDEGTRPARQVCPAGHFCANSTTKESCVPGHFCAAGATAPEPCEKGTFSQVRGAPSRVSCVPCSDGLCCPRGSPQAVLCDDALSIFAILALVVALMMAWLLGILLYLRFWKRHPFALRVCNPVQVTSLFMVGADFALDLLALGALPQHLPVNKENPVFSSID